jgi:hypothetical protein
MLRLHELNVVPARQSRREPGWFNREREAMETRIHECNHRLGFENQRPERIPVKNGQGLLAQNMRAAPARA